MIGGRVFLGVFSTAHLTQFFLRGRTISRIVTAVLIVLSLAAWRPADQTPAPQNNTPASTSSEPANERYRQVEVEPINPLEALEYRAALCEHYSGEFGGDGSERDHWLNAQMNHYRCGDELVAEARTMKAARAGETDVVARLNAVIAIYAEH